MVSVLQTLGLEKPLVFKDNYLSRSLSPEQVIYSPIKDVFSLLYGMEPMREGPGREICMTIIEDNQGVLSEAEIVIKKGRNKNIMVQLLGEEICKKMSDINQTYSMYVPGLAGLPFQEEYRSLGAVRRAVAKGDCNTILRNVLYHLYNDAEHEKWLHFLQDLNAIFPEISLRIDARLDNDGVIDVYIQSGDFEKPIDAMGTGVLQAIQISAYMNYFEPQLLLLDEPDSHLHPNNQKTLAHMILQLADRNKNILIATHSRHLVGALRRESQIFLMKEGQKLDTKYSEYDILMEIGALDEYDVFRDPNIKYIIATEDSKAESLERLKLLLTCSGFNENEFYILPYEGADKIESVIYLARCLNRFRGDLTIVVHRDLDGMDDAAKHAIIDRIQQESNTHCFITDHNDVEVYFCIPAHVSSVLSEEGYEVTEEFVIEICNQAYREIAEKAKEKYLNRVLDSTREQGKGKLALEAQEYYDNNVLQCVNGHMFMGSLVSILHSNFADFNKKMLMKPSKALNIPSLHKIAVQESFA